MKNLKFLLSTFLFFVAIYISAQDKKPEDPLNGPKKDYHPNGKISREYTVVNGIPNGSYKAYSEAGLLVAEQNLVDGIQEGIQKTFFENGQVQSEMNYEKGVPQGMKKEYYKNGTLKTDSNLTGDPWELSGQTTLYYEDGQKKSESKVSMGKHVFTITYDKEGRVTTEQTEGQIISYHYDRDGKKHTSVNGVDQNK